MSLHVDVRGRGPALVLLHGWALHGETWGPWVDALESHARLHIVDLPGHGHSEWPDGATRLSDFAQLIDRHVPREAVLLGWSLGGMVAMELARLRGRRVPALVLIATTPKFVADDGWPHGVTAGLLADFAGRLRDDYHRTVQNFLALQTRGDEHALAAFRELRHRLARRPAPARAALDTGLAMLHGTDLRGAVGAITAPALVISGEHDRLTPAGAGQWLAASLPEARHHLVRGAAHATFLSHADEVLATVLRFLSGLVTPGAAEVSS